MNGRYTPDDVGPPAPRHAVTFGPCAVAVGFLVGLTTLVLALIPSLGIDLSLMWNNFAAALGVFFLVLWWGTIIGIFTGLPLGIILGLLLRPVRNQWIHVAVFFGCFAGVALAASPLLFPSPWALENLPTVLVIGGAGALARASVWKLVRVREG